MSNRSPSRVLNNPSVLFGLSFNDLIGLAVLLGILQICLKPFGLEFYALVLTGFALVALIPLRMRYRRKSIRDYIRYCLERRIGVGSRH